MRAIGTLLVGLAVALAAAACSGCDADSSRPAPAAPTAEKTAPDAPTPAPPRPKLDEAPVRATLDAWLAAQNARDFAAYERLYAAKVEGVKRVGARTYRYDREGWLADRKRMFGKPMKVAIEGVAIKGGAASVSVTFTQSFTQGRFSDRGPKQLVLTRGEADPWLIAREEMLRSELGGNRAAADPTDDTHLVLPFDGAPHVMIQPDPEALGGTGPIRRVASEIHLLATQSASGSPLVSAWKGRVMKVLDAKGDACEATVGELVLVSGGQPHFYEIGSWDGYPEGDPIEGVPPSADVLTEAQQAEYIFHMSPPYLAGRLQVKGDCVPVIALNPDAKVTVFREDTEAPHTTKVTSAETAFRALQDYERIQREEAPAFQDVRAQWADAVTASVYAAAGRTFIEVDGSSSDRDGCDQPTLSVLFEVQKGKLVPVLGPFTYLHVVMVVDSDGDGVVEVIGSSDPFEMLTARFLLDPKTPVDQRQAIQDVSFTYSDCGC